VQIRPFNEEYVIELYPATNKPTPASILSKDNAQPVFNRQQQPFKESQGQWRETPELPQNVFKKESLDQPHTVISQLQRNVITQQISVPIESNNRDFMTQTSTANK
jgi:hypothetical protein